MSRGSRVGGGVIDFGEIEPPPRSRTRGSKAREELGPMYTEPEVMQVVIPVGGGTSVMPSIASAIAGERTVFVAKYTNLDKIIKAWDHTGIDPDVKWDKICSLTLSNATKNLSEVKEHVLMFSDEKATDGYSEALSPKFGGPLPLLSPTPDKYASPMHYVEAMKIMCSLTTAAALSPGGIELDPITGETNISKCDIIRIHMDPYIHQPHADVIKRFAAECEIPAIKKQFYDTETILGKYWLSLWIALWAKYQLYGKYMSTLVGTGNKLLIYLLDSDDKAVSNYYGMQADEGTSAGGTMKGINAVGILLMIMRQFARSGILANKSASPNGLYDKFVKHILENIFNIKYPAATEWDNQKYVPPATVNLI
jgi:hypothetical protein